jgi:DNA-binding SARP family transcriptional activator/Tfp pilus assembly protein PilF
MIDIRALGTLEIHPPDGGASVVALTQPKRIALLLYLALAEPSGPKSRDSLMALLWPEADDESARHSLRNVLYGLRQTLGEDAFVSRVEGYVGLEPGMVRCDALEVRRLLAERKWEEAVAAWGGDLVPGFHVSGAPEFDQWLEGQRTSLRRSVTEAAWRRVDELERSGDAGLVPAAQRAWELDPGNEAGARRLIRFLDGSVGRAAALRAYDELVDYLHRELEAEPSAETRALAGELKARIEPQVSHVPPTLPAPPEPSTRRPETQAGAPSGPSARRWRVTSVAAVIVGAILMASVMSVLALRPKGATALTTSSDPMTRAEREGVLRLPARFRHDSAAYRSYLRGLALQFQGHHPASRDTFAALVGREPLYAPGFSGLAHANALIIIDGSTPPAEGWPKVEQAAHRAVALDSTAASAYLALGAMEMFWRWNLPRAGQLIDRALALDPGDPEVHAVRGAWFRWRGELDSSLAEARTSHQLDPLDPFFSDRTAIQLYLARRYAEAEAAHRQTIRDYPQRAEPYYGLSAVYRAMGRMRDALSMQRTGLEVAGDSAAAVQIPLATSEADAARVFADMARKDIRDLESKARHGDWVSPSSIADAYAELGDTNQTLGWLDSMVVGHDPLLWRVLVNPRFDFLRNDPRYREWERKLTWRQ